MADRSDSLKLYEDQPQEVTTADILRKYGPTEPDERGMLLPISRTGDKLSLDWPSAIYEPYQAIKRLVTRPVAPGYLSSSGDRRPIEDSFNAAAAVAAPSLGLNYAGMAPKNAVGIFGGRLAKTADQAALARAEEMAAKGADRRAIWDETGWFQGKDGKWRFEIDDSASAIHPMVQNGEVARWSLKDGINMQETLSHPSLYDAYPESAGIGSSGKVTGIVDKLMGKEVNGLSGFYGVNEATGRPIIHMEASSPENMRRGLLHELQHDVQQSEKFAPGAASNTYTQQKEAELARDALSWRRELDRMPKGMDRSAKENAVIQQYQELGAMDFVPSREARDLAMDIHTNPTPQLEQLVNLYGLDRKVTPSSPMEMYRRSAGEVEARNVEKRMNMTPEERRATPPWETQDVPDTQQILRMYGDGLQMSQSLPMDEAARLARAREMGFDVDNPMYRGVATVSPTGEFTANAGDWGRGVYMGNQSTANGYANGFTHYDNVSPAVYGPLFARGKLADVATQLDVEEAVRKLPKFKKASPSAVTEEANRRLKEMGYSGVTQGKGYSTLVFDPKNVRSATAAFDPAKRGSANLLASSTPADPLTTQMILRQYGKEEE